MAFDEVINAINNNAGGFFFLYGYGGIGKTFLWKTLSTSLRSADHIVLNVAFSGIASLLLPNGRTAHSRFKIPLNVNEDSTCNIRKGSSHAKLLMNVKLIIWDEVPMLSKYCHEALDRCLRDVLPSMPSYTTDLPFGGKIIVLGGDFRQILPVIPKGSKEDIVQATISSSYLWPFYKVLRLSKNMRLCANGNDAAISKVNMFSDWLLKIGNGLAGESSAGHAETEVQILDDLLIDNTDSAFDELVAFVYPSIHSNLKNVNYFKERSILAPTLEIVAHVNNYIMAILRGQEKIYLSFDSVCIEEGNMELEIHAISPKILNGFNCSGIPPHKLVLKEGVLIMLLQNIDQYNGLCNGTRL